MGMRGVKIWDRRSTNGEDDPLTSKGAGVAFFQINGSREYSRFLLNDRVFLDPEYDGGAVHVANNQVEDDGGVGSCSGSVCSYALG